MPVIKRKIDGEWHLMPDGEYSLCGLAFDGDLDSLMVNMQAKDTACKSAREINCPGCKKRIDVVRQLLKLKEAK